MSGHGHKPKALSLYAVYAKERAWLLGRLQSGPVSCFSLKQDPWPASGNPAQRVLELRRAGHDIRTLRDGRTFTYALFVGGVMMEARG